MRGFLLVMVSGLAFGCGGSQPKKAPQAMPFATPIRRPAPPPAEDKPMAPESEQVRRARILSGEVDGVVDGRDGRGNLTFRGMYRAGQKDGIWFEFDAVNGWHELGPYERGRKHGVWATTYVDKRELLSTQDWNLGQREGISVNYRNGKPSMIHNVRGGQLRGYYWLLPASDGVDNLEREGCWGEHSGIGTLSDPFARGEPFPELRRSFIEAVDRHGLAIRLYPDQIGQ